VRAAEGGQIQEGPIMKHADQRYAVGSAVL
jgi:hypothetical protein